jgi:hypothetical protein
MIIRKLKTLISIILLTLIVFHFNGQIIVFKIFEYRIKKEVKTRIKMGVPEKELTLLKIPKSLEENPGNDFKRIHDKEFRYKGEMYDIVSKAEKDDTTYFYCIHDEEETKLFANLDRLIQNEFNDPEKKKELTNYTNLLNSFYFKQEFTVNEKIPSSKRQFLSNFFETISIIFNPQVPPPKPIS